MCSIEKHCNSCKKKYGYPFKQVHKWMDELVKIMGPSHRKYRHDINKTPNLAYEIFKDKIPRKYQLFIKEAVLDHIILDKESSSINYKGKKRNILKKAKSLYINSNISVIEENPMKNFIERNCEICGSQITLDASITERIDIQSPIFCSKECAKKANSYSRNKHVLCPMCQGIPLVRFPKFPCPNCVDNGVISITKVKNAGRDIQNVANIQLVKFFIYSLDKWSFEEGIHIINKMQIQVSKSNNRISNIWFSIETPKLDAYLMIPKKYLKEGWFYIYDGKNTKKIFEVIDGKSFEEGLKQVKNMIMERT